MADNIEITPGTGKQVATDDTGTEHVQIVKLALATDGSKTPIPADATVGLAVKPHRGGTAAHTSLDNGDSPFGDTTPASDELVASNADRLAVLIQNVGDVTVYLGFGTAALTTTGFELGVGATYSDDVFTGAINAIPASDSGGQEVRAVEFD